MRNRNNSNNNNHNHRKGQNPLMRSYESSGPDVKIRGSAQQIAEKYATLARDAQSFGDRIMAENYLQHAEHYNRIIAAAMVQMPFQHQQQASNDFDTDVDTNGERDCDSVGNTAELCNQQPQLRPTVNDSSQSPEIAGTPAEVMLNTEAISESQPREGCRGRSRNYHEGRRERRLIEHQVEVPQAAAQVEVAVEQPQPEVVVAEAVSVAEAAESKTLATLHRGRRPRRGERAVTAAQDDAEEASAVEPVGLDS